jgi:glycosyltransferase involved in cell wall biosynthesis
MNNNYLLSIIIPVWNGERFVGNVLSQLIAQDLAGIEVIVVNDGSTDNTENVILEYANKNTHIKLISLKENAGESVARNTGIKNAIGKYIWFLDCDDAISDKTLDFYREFLPNRNNGIIIFDYEIIRKGKTEIIKNCKYDGREFNASDFLKLFFVRKIRTNICSQLYLKSFLNDNALRFMEGVTRGADVIFYRTAFFYAKSIYCCSQIVFIYQIRQDSTTGGYEIYRIESIKNLAMSINNFENLIKLQPNVKKHVNYFLAENYVGNLIRYIRFADKDTELIATQLLKYKSLLSKKMHFRFPKTVIFWILRLVPINFIFRIFGKGVR